MLDEYKVRIEDMKAGVFMPDMAIARKSAKLACHDLDLMGIWADVKCDVEFIGCKVATIALTEHELVAAHEARVFKNI